MKYFILILIYISLALFFFCLLSGIAYLFSEYTWKQITTEGAWQIVYLIIHWIPCGIIIEDLSESDYFKY